MGRYVVKLPDIGEGTTEAEIVAWHVKPGQAIREDDPLADVMTDKATVEIAGAGRRHGRRAQRQARREAAGRLRAGGARGGGRGQCRGRSRAPPAAKSAAARPAPHPTLSPRARERASGQAPKRVPSPRAAGEDGCGQQRQPPRAGEGGTPRHPPPPRRKPLASPAVRRRAWDLGIALQFVPGTGPGRPHHPRRTSTLIAAPPMTSRPPPRPRCNAATGSRRSRSSACAARSPSICSCRSGASRISPMSRRSTSPRWRILRAHLNATYPDRGT